MDVQAPSRTKPPPGEREFITDNEAAELLGLSKSRLAELQREPDFPPACWLGPRGKRHIRVELLAWALKRRGPK